MNNRRTLNLYTSDAYQIMEVKVEFVINLLVQLGWMEIKEDEDKMPNLLLLKNIEIIEDEQLVERVARLAPYFNKGLASLNDHPIVGETRSVGLIGAIELSKNKATRARFHDSGRVGTICRDHSFNTGLVMRACWDTMVLAPPFCITEKQIDDLVKLARTALDKTYEDVKTEM